MNIPIEIMIAVSEIIEKNQLPAEVMGATEDDEVIIQFQYDRQISSAVFEIMEMIDEYNETEKEQEDD